MSKTDSFFNPDQYATVAERIELFYARYPEGRINTDLVGRADGEITFKAHIYRSAAETLAAATGWASEREGDGEINTVACLENTETSAVGRALANLGFTASSKRPSREEMEKAVRARSSFGFAGGDPVNYSDPLGLCTRADNWTNCITGSAIQYSPTTLSAPSRRRTIAGGYDLRDR